MSRRNNIRPGNRGPQLPLALQEKLGLPQHKRKPRTQVSERKQRRQDLRKGHFSDGIKRRKIHHDVDVQSDDIYAEIDGGNDDIDSEDVDEGSDVDVDENHQSVAIPLSGHHAAVKQSHVESLSRSNSSRSPSPLFDLGEESDDLSRGSREYSPEVVLDANTKSFRDKQAEEDAEILALERRLGKKSRNSTQAADDNFDGLLGGLTDAGSSSSAKRQDKEWLKNKRSARVQPFTPVDDMSSDEHMDVPRESEESGNDFAGFDDDEEEEEEEVSSDNDELDSEFDTPIEDKRISDKKPQRENPYKAPVVNSNETTTAKYIPPSRRNLPTTETEKLDRLRRQVQGTLNKLSEANIISIVAEFEKLYQTNPRQDVTTVTLDLLLTAFCIPSTLQNTFIILHAALVAALYKILGADFGAESVSRLTEAFDKHHNENAVQGKEAVNLASVLANLYIFGVISSGLVYDHVRLLLADFTEQNAELLLRIIRDCGPQLRSDDPSALKSIVQSMNDVSAKITSNGGTINIRTRVMMDTITDLKNNKIRQATNAAGATGEHLTRMRKALGSLNTRQLRATEPLGITRADIVNSDRKGKWWLVGASWKGKDLTQHDNSVRPITSQDTGILPGVADDDLDPDSVDYNALSRHYKFTTPTHRSIFTAILSATDATDALQRISKLRLTRKQEAEVPRVLLRICRAEPVYNPYYAVLSRLLLRDAKRFKFAFEVALWKFFEEIGERSDEDGDSDSEGRNGEAVQAYEIANVANLYATLVARQALTIDLLKTLNIGFLKENAALWLEMFFIALLSSPRLKDEKVVGIFSGLRSDMITSTLYFLRKNVRRSDLMHDKEEKQRVKHGVKMVEAALVATSREELDE